MVQGLVVRPPRTAPNNHQFKCPDKAAPHKRCALFVSVVDDRVFSGCAPRGPAVAEASEAREILPISVRCMLAEHERAEGGKSRCEMQKLETKNKSACILCPLAYSEKAK